MSLLSYQRPQIPFLILEVYPFRQDQFIVYIIDMKTKSSITIGRSTQADIGLSDLFLSRSHSIIKYHDQQFYFDDLNSKYGSMVMIKNELFFLKRK